MGKSAETKRNERSDDRSRKWFEKELNERCVVLCCVVRAYSLRTNGRRVELVNPCTAVSDSVELEPQKFGFQSSKSRVRTKTP